MILSAQDIQSQKFHVRFRGFDVEEVDDFLEKTAASFQALFEENQKLQARLEALAQELTTYQSQQKTFQNAIIAAQNVAEGMKEKSRLEAEAIVAAAHEEARRRREEADREIDGLNGKIERLKGLREETRDELRQQLNAYLAMLEEDRLDAAGAADFYDRGERPIIVTPAPRVAAADQPLAPADRAEEPETGHDDLYVKINIPDIQPPEFKQQEEDNLPELYIVLPTDEEQDQAMPDMDSDLVFELEDPLAEHEPEVSFSETLEEARQKDKGRFNPDESPL